MIFARLPLVAAIGATCLLGACAAGGSYEGPPAAGGSHAATYNPGPLEFGGYEDVRQNDTPQFTGGQSGGHGQSSGGAGGGHR
jgi:hypothetical protein